MKPRALDLYCYFCGGRLKSDNAWFEVHDQELPPFHKPLVRFNQHGGKEERGALAYPGNGENLALQGEWSSSNLVVLFAHTECGPDIGYNFPFERLNEDWDGHLQGKVWWCSVIAEALEIARKAMPRRHPTGIKVLGHG
jgi:hypothetical protein